MAGELEGWRTRAKVAGYAEAAGLDPTLSDEALRLAYQSVLGDARSEHVQLVMADLAVFCEFYSLPPQFDVDPISIARHVGRREAFARIFHFLTLPERVLSELEEAARDDAAAVMQQGET